jgi:hypothetical protein
VAGFRQQSTRVFSLAMILIGLALVVQTVVRDDGAWLRAVLGALFVAAGVARLYLQARAS